MIQLRKDIVNIGKAITLVYNSDPKYCIIKFGLIVVAGTMPIITLYLLKHLIDQVTYGITIKFSGNISQVWIYAGLYCFVYLIGRIVSITAVYVDEILTQRFTDYMTTLLHQKSIELDLEYYDDPTYHDTFHRAQQESGYRPMQIVNNLTSLITSGISLAGIVIILISFSWWVALSFILAGLPTLWINIAKYKKLYNWRKENTPLFRKADYYSKLLTNRTYAKEVRVFNLGEFFRKKFVDLRKGLIVAVLKISRKQAFNDSFSAIFDVLALLLIIVLLVLKLYSGVITMGSFVMFFEAFRRGQNFLQITISNISGMYNNKLFLNNLYEFFLLEPHIKSPEKPVPFPEKLHQGIIFNNVSFTYPGSDKIVIENFSFEMKPNQINLLQGQNGMGKTTLVKLLYRLYDCSHGEILIDGINIKNFDLHELRKNISVIFQDFVQYDFTVRENIILADIECDTDRENLERAAILSCAKPVIDNLPRGYDTMLGKYFVSGEELSMGQWQRIALGRALYKNAPILILDEPTSWMDMESRSFFYKQLNKIKDSRVILLITHSTEHQDINLTRPFYKYENLTL